MALEINRRPLLQGFMLAGAAGLSGPAAPAFGKGLQGKSLNLDSKTDLSLIFRKLAYSMEAKLGFWHLTATRYGLVGTKLLPFWDMHIGRFFMAHDREDGTYDVTQTGLTFYTDPQTGAYLRAFQNPLTGKRVDIHYEAPNAKRYAAPQPLGAHYEAIDVRGETPAGPAKPGLITVGSVGPAWVEGDNIWIQQDHLLEYPSPRNRGVLAHVNDLTTYFGSLSEVADPTVKTPRAGFAFSDINDWPAWLEMGDQPGAYYSRGMGFKAFSFDEMPAVWKALALQHYPKVARDPLRVLQAL